MQDEQKFLEEYFNQSLQTYLLLEKTIYESVAAYDAEPTEQMKKVICDMCSFGRREISLLIELLARFSNGKLFEDYKNNLELKSDELFSIRKRIDVQRQK